MRIESRDQDTTLYLERGERHDERIAGPNRVHLVFNAAGQKIYTYVDVGAAAAPFEPHVRIQKSWNWGWNGERLRLLTGLGRLGVAQRIATSHRARVGVGTVLALTLVCTTVA